MDSIGALTAQTAALGEYFALPAPGDGEWHELPVLFDDAVLMEFVDRTRAAIATATGSHCTDIPRRMAASSFQLGIAARLLSPGIGAATCFGVVPVLNSSSVRWQLTEKHSPRFAFSEVPWVATPTSASAVDAISASVLRDVIKPLNELLTALTSLSPQVTWGNVTSAANGAVTVLSLSHPHHERTGRALIRALLATETLAGTGSFVQDRFVRRNCCLFYQAPGSGLCGDCVLAS